MQEMFCMLSTQNAHMHDQLENINVLKVKPEKFSGSGASFHSFMAQFENCSLINKWTPQEKLLMLRSSLTGNTLSVLWHIRMDRDCTYEDLYSYIFIFIHRCPRATNSRWTPPTARQCKYCPEWARNKKEMNEHVKRRHFDILERRREEHELREKIDEKERLLI